MPSDPPSDERTTPVPPPSPALPARWVDDAGYWAAAVGLLAYLALGAVVQTHPRLPAVSLFLAGLVPLHLAAFGTALVVLFRRCPAGTRLRSLELAGGPLRPGQVLRRSALVLLAAYPLAVALTVVAVALVTRLGYRPEGSPMTALLLNQKGPFFWVVAVLGTLVLAPVAEEILFRLVLFDILSPRLPAAELVTTLLFAVAHQVPEELPGSFVLGLLLQRARARHRTLWVPIVAHAGFNAVSLLLLLLVRFGHGFF